MRLRAAFRGMNTELPADGLPSGVCTSTLNTVVEGNHNVKGRAGLEVFSSAVINTNKTILNMTVATLLDTSGDAVTFVVVKASDGRLYFKDATAAAATAWTEIVTRTYSWTHSTTERGWFFVYANQVYYSDSSGTSKWHPGDTPDGTTYVWRAGIRSTVGPLLEAAASDDGAAKEGLYRAAISKKNTKTGEISSFAYGPAAAVETRVSADTPKGALGITNWDSGSEIQDNATDLLYEWDAVTVWCTLGDTEYSGLGAGSEIVSYEFYKEVDVAYSHTGNIGMYRADAVIAKFERPTEAGGEPPGSEFGFYNGSQALYLEVTPRALNGRYTAGTLCPGMFMFSLPGFPTMVPQERYHDLATVNDYKMVKPKPWIGVDYTGIAGAVTGCGGVGSRFIVFTENATYSLAPMNDGRLFPTIIDPINGCLSKSGVVSTGRAVHALGSESWLKITTEGITNVARLRFTDTLTAIPSAGRNDTVGAPYGFRSEVWMATAKTGGTANKAQRILIYDEAKDELVGMFDPANLGTSGITAMCELAAVAQSPVMLLATDNVDAVIYKYPGSAYTDDGTAYACHWEGYFGQESRMHKQRLTNVAVAMEDNVDDGISLRITGVQTAASSDEADAVTIGKEDAVQRSGAEFDPYLNGRMFKLKISSSTSQGAEWSVADLSLDLKRIA